MGRVRRPQHPGFAVGAAMFDCKLEEPERLKITFIEKYDERLNDESVDMMIRI